MRQILLLLVLMSCQFYVAKGQDKPSSPNDREKNVEIAEFERLIGYYRYYKQDSAVYFVEKGLIRARELKDSVGVGLLLLQSGMIDDNQGDFESSGDKYQEALEIFKHS